MIDLDAAKAARREALGETPGPALFGGREFSLPAELPFPVVLSLGELADAQAAGDQGRTAKVIGDVVGGIFGDQYSEFLALGPSLGDLEVLLVQLMREYGMDLGEASASESSSESTSGPQKPISKLATA